MEKRVTWDDIYNEFRKNHPTLSKLVSSWRPIDCGMIEIKLKEGDAVIYDYYMHQAKFK